MCSNYKNLNNMYIIILYRNFKIFNLKYLVLVHVYCYTQLHCMYLRFQAVLASDFNMGRFKFLKKLLLVHGHWCYSRLANMMLYFFYKNVVSNNNNVKLHLHVHVVAILNSTIALRSTEFTCTCFVVNFFYIIIPLIYVHVHTCTLCFFCVIHCTCRCMQCFCSGSNYSMGSLVLIQSTVSTYKYSTWSIPACP